MAIAGIIGFVFAICKFNSAALILGLVLGTLCESNLRRAVTIANGDTLMGEFIYLLKRPITGIIMPVCVIMLLLPVIKPLFSKKKNKTAA